MMKLGAVVQIVEGLVEGEPGAHYPALRAETLQDEIAWARDFGFPGLQVSWSGSLSVAPEQIADLCRKEEVEVTALSAYTDFLSPEHNWPCRDLMEVKQRITDASAMGVDTIVTWGGFGDSANEKNRQQVRADLTDAVRFAEKHNIKVALELYDNCVVGTVEDIVDLAEGLESHALGIMMDPPNTMKESDLTDLPGYYARLIQDAGDRMFGVHAKGVLFENGQRKLPGPGEGQQDYVAFIRVLTDAEFDGHLLIEHVSRGTVEAARDFVAGKIEEALEGRG